MVCVAHGVGLSGILRQACRENTASNRINLGTASAFQVPLPHHPPPPPKPSISRFISAFTSSTYVVGRQQPQQQCTSTHPAILLLLHPLMPAANRTSPGRRHGPDAMTGLGKRDDRLACPNRSFFLSCSHIHFDIQLIWQTPTCQCNAAVSGIRQPFTIVTVSPSHSNVAKHRIFTILPGRTANDAEFAPCVAITLSVKHNNDRVIRECHQMR
jgi:hypothetical protein